MNSEDFMEETEGLSIPALEDLGRFWEELGAVAVFRVAEIRDTLRRRYEQEEMNYWFTDYGMVVHHDRHDRRRDNRGNQSA